MTDLVFQSIGSATVRTIKGADMGYDIMATKTGPQAVSTILPIA